MRTWLLTLVCLLLPTTALAPTRVVELWIRTRVAFEPADLPVTARVARHSDNRRLELTWDSLGMSGRSDTQLDGDAAPAVHTRWLRSLSAGDYEVRATVVGTHGVRGSAAVAVQILAR